MVQVSADHSRLAYAVDLTGEEQYELYSKEIGSSTVTPVTKLGDSSGSMAWASENNTFFYVTLVKLCTCMLLAYDCMKAPKKTMHPGSNWGEALGKGIPPCIRRCCIPAGYVFTVPASAGNLTTKDICRVIRTAYTRVTECKVRKIAV